MSHQDVRSEQEQEGKSRSGTLRVPAGRRGGSATTMRKPFVAKGHDAILKALQDAGAQIVVTPIGDGVSVTGVLVARDKYTITVKTASGRTVTYYKHALESFEPALVQ